MGLGLGIVLIVLGAIISFTTLDESIVSTNLDAVGWILIVGGALAIVIGLIMNAQRSNTSHRTVVEHHDTGVPPEALEHRDEPR